MVNFELGVLYICGSFKELGFDGFKAACSIGIGQNSATTRLSVATEAHEMIQNYSDHIQNYLATRIPKPVAPLGIVMEGF